MNDISAIEPRRDTVPIPDIASPTFKADPWPVCEVLRAGRPVVRVPVPTDRGEAYLVTHYADAAAAGRALRQGRADGQGPGPSPAALDTALHESALPHHAG